MVGGRLRVLVQRVSSANVTVDNEIRGEVGQGLLLLVGFGKESGQADVEWMVRKVSQLRVFPDSKGLMNLSVQDICGQILVISQFTLYGDCRKGRRPSFEPAMAPDKAESLYQLFVSGLKTVPDIGVETGTFGADMKVALTNDGPVTLLLERGSRQNG